MRYLHALYFLILMQFMIIYTYHFLLGLTREASIDELEVKKIKDIFCDDLEKQTLVT